MNLLSSPPSFLSTKPFLGSPTLLTTQKLFKNPCNLPKSLNPQAASLLRLLFVSSPPKVCLGRGPLAFGRQDYWSKYRVSWLTCQMDCLNTCRKPEKPKYLLYQAFSLSLKMQRTPSLPHLKETTSLDTSKN